MTVSTFSAWRKVKDRTHILGVVDADERKTCPGEAEDAVESRKSTIVSGRRSAIGWDYEASSRPMALLWPLTIVDFRDSTTSSTAEEADGTTRRYGEN